MEKKNLFTVLGMCMVFATGLTGCGESQTDNIKQNVSEATNDTLEGTETSDTTEVETGEDQTASYPLSVENFNQTTTYDKAPEKVIALSYSSAELLTALGLEESVIAIYQSSNTVDEVSPEYQEAVKKIPVPESINSGGVPTLENMLALKGDMIISQSYFYNVAAFGTMEDYAANGVNIYVPEGTYVLGADMENVYTDIRNFGNIFGVQERAEELIADMQEQIAEVTTAIEGQASVKVMVFDSEMNGAIYTSGGGSLENSLIELAGGENVFADLEEQFTSIAVEEIISRNPEVIVINDYGALTAEEKIDYLKSLEELSEVDAIKNERFVSIPFFSVMPGVQNTDVVKVIASELYPELFNAE